MEMLMHILKPIVRKLGESIWSKVVEWTTDSALNNSNNVMDFKLNLKTLQRDLKSLSAKASDVEEEIKNAEFSGRKKRKQEVDLWLEEVRSIEKQVVELENQVESEGFVMRLIDGGAPKQLSDEVEKLLEQSRNFGQLLLDVCGTRGEPFLLNELVGNAFHGSLETISQLLATRQLASIGVYASGGAGKTTLAKHVHNRLLQQYQASVIWITVSQEVTIKNLQDKIGRFLGVNLLEEEEEDIRAARLHKALSQQRNLVLILDDVWRYIDMLKVGCRVSVECCKLIITTRSLEVCRQVRCHRIFQVEKLSEDEAWDLFNKTLGNEIELSFRVEVIAKSVAKLCGGLPLGIVAVAGCMRGETTIYTWRKAFVELEKHVVGQDGMSIDEVVKVLDDIRRCASIGLDDGQDGVRSSDEVVEVVDRVRSSDDVVEVLDGIRSGDEVVEAVDGVRRSDEVVEVLDGLRRSDEVVEVVDRVRSSDEVVEVLDRVRSGDEVVEVQGRDRSSDEVVGVQDHARRGDEAMSVDEFNQRVEAFIQNFNKQMRSLREDKVNRGAYGELKSRALKFLRLPSLFI